MKMSPCKKAFCKVARFKIFAPSCLNSISAFLVLSALPAVAAIDLKANFRLYGEVYRFGLGRGNVPIHFGVNTVPAQQIGDFGYLPGGRPFANGVLSTLTLPTAGVPGVVDHRFSVPFSLEESIPASLYIGMGDNGINSISGGNVQVYFDFSDNIYFPGWSILGPAPDQGLTLEEFTLASGESLESAGYNLSFIPAHTILTAGVSAFDRLGLPLTVDRHVAGTQNLAAVNFGNATASSKLIGGQDGRGGITNAQVDLDLHAEPDPYVYDFAFATVSGSNNIVLTRGPIPPVPAPAPILGAIVVARFSRKLRQRIRQSKH